MAQSKDEKRTWDANYQAEKRKESRDLKIARVAEPNRRRDCLADIYQFLPTYFPAVFYQPFTSDRRDMIDALLHAAQYGGDQAIAGPRGDGKTRSALFVALALILAGHQSFPLIISKSGPRSNRELKNLKHAIQENNGGLLAADFPEIVAPIIALGRWSSRARQQTVYGEYTDLEWGADCIVLPTIRERLLWDNGWNHDIKPVANGQVIASLGIEGPIRGYAVRSLRPTLAILDDIDDRESARSEMQTAERERIIEEDVGGLAGPDRTVSRVMLCTLINRTCIAAKFTDRQVKQSWRGQRHKLLEKLPERVDLWEDYMALRRDRAEDDPDARAAHRFYSENREAMDAGAVVTNPYRFDSRALKDGQPSELSALQACYNIICDRGWDHFATEYQNDPPEESGLVESGITAGKIQRRLSGYERRMVPPECTVLVQGMDLQKAGAHWVVRAVRPDATSYVIDYGFHESHGTKYGSDDGVEHAIRRVILERMEAVKSEPYHDLNGEVVEVALTLVDSGWLAPAVYQACKEIGIGIYPAKGAGKSHGCAIPNFYEIMHKTKDRKPGDGWFQSRQPSGVWLTICDTDRWKAFEHARWMTDQGKPGCAYLYGDMTSEERKHLDARLPKDSKGHHSYAHHITAETEVEDVVRGVVKRFWKVKPGRVQNHYLDASYLANVAAAMKGIRLLGDKSAIVKVNPADRPSLAQLAARK